jgi:hypothetical protein
MIFTVRWLIFLILSAVVLFLLFLPDLMPRCSYCGRYKLRPLFRIHRAVSINPGYGGSRSVCTKCCREYDIESLQDLDRLIAIKRRLKLDSLTKEQVP